MMKEEKQWLGLIIGVLSIAVLLATLYTLLYVAVDYLRSNWL